jgi:hypothetical protein
MKNKTVHKIPSIVIYTLFFVFGVLTTYVMINKTEYFQHNKSTIPTLDKPDYYPPDSSIPYYTLKWMNNIKFTKKELLKKADIQTSNEGKISRISFKKGEVNIDKAKNVNYPFVVRIELIDPNTNKTETLFFSKTRYEKAQIYRTDELGIDTLVKWEDIKVGEYVTIAENINLLISNVDEKNNFTDKYLNSLIIHVK